VRLRARVRHIHFPPGGEVVRAFKLLLLSFDVFPGEFDPHFRTLTKTKTATTWRFFLLFLLAPSALSRAEAVSEIALI